MLLEHTVRLGRASSVDLPLEDPTVSKVHATLRLAGGKWLVEDAGSRNGTMVNGAKIGGPVELRAGDRIVVGSTTLEFALHRPSRATGRFTVVDQTTLSEVQVRVGQGGAQGHFVSAAAVRDVEQLRADYEKLRVAYELMRAVGDAADINVLLERVLHVATDLFGAERGILLMARSDGSLEPVASRVRSQDSAERPGSEADSFTIPRSILREVVEERQAVLSSDAKTDARFQAAESVILHSIRATMSVPLLAGERLHGVIHLDSRLDVAVFTEQDLHLLSGFASQAAQFIELVQLREKMQQQALSRDRLARLLPPEVVDDVMSGRVRLERGGTATEATVLFVDIRGFTSWTETRPAAEVVQGLNAYFDVMADAIFTRGGTLDKFIGDEIMAVWGAPIPSATHSEDAVRAAIGMMKALDTLNEQRVSEGLPALAAGIGINAGPLVAGYMGSRRAMSWTVLGDVVNVAARLCAAAEPGQILVGASVARAVADIAEVVEEAPRRFKGKAEPIPVARVLGLR